MKVLWQDKKRWLFFGLPWTFTKYTVLDEKILIDSGLLTSKQDEIRLYRVIDITLTRTLFQKLFKLGTITCNTSDKTCPILEFKNIPSSMQVKELLSQAVEEERVKKRVLSREVMHDSFDDDDDDYDHH